MTRWTLILIVVAGGLLFAGGSTFVWRRETASSIARLRGFLGGVANRSAPIAFDSLPAPVARYFTFALPDDDPGARTVHIRWKGEFRMRPDARWVPFSATQDCIVDPPGFVWDASIRMLPLVRVRVRDAYAGSSASMLGRIGGLVTVVDQGDSPELAQSALARWIGEATTLAWLA